VFSCVVQSSFEAKIKGITGVFIHLVLPSMFAKCLQDGLVIQW